MRNVRHNWNVEQHYNPTVKKDETVMTIPGQAINIKEAKRRLKAGLGVPVFNMEYSEQVPRVRIKSITDVGIARKQYENWNEKVKTAKLNAIVRKAKAEEEAKKQPKTE